MVVLRRLTALFLIDVRAPSWKSSTSLRFVDERFVTFRRVVLLWFTALCLTSRCFVILERCVSPWQSTISCLPRMLGALLVVV